MRRPASPSPTWRTLLGATISLLAMGLLAPGTARAGCSHESPGAAGSLDHFALLKDCGAMATEGADWSRAPMPSRPQESPGACTGPSCSRRNGLPPTSTSFGSPRFHQWACLDLRPWSPDPLASRGAGDEGDVRPVRSADLIFHPPRPIPLAD